MKRILGLDLGTTSIGWALVNEAENDEEKSSIIKIGVRVVPLTVDEQTNFEKGKSITTNADRCLKRSMRRNLQRYKLRREHLVNQLIDAHLIDDDTILCECGNRTTYETYRLRAKAVTEEISLAELARVLIMINKKRGYKSSRKTNSSEEGQLIDGMEIAKTIYNEGLTPGQYVLSTLRKGIKLIPDFYASDLRDEFDKIWSCQAIYYPDILTDEFKLAIVGKSKKETAFHFKTIYNISTIENKGKGIEKHLQAYKWRAGAVSDKIELDELAYVLSEINGDINGTSGYLGKISDHSKELYFNHITIGQYLMRNINNNPHYSVRNVVFYRQDYLDEFEAIWTCQAKYHTQLTNELKSAIRDTIIFYQRPLKSQKSKLSLCEFEHHTIEIEVDGQDKKKEIGLKVCPKSSPLFQEFKIWQTLNNIKVVDKETYDTRDLTKDEKNLLFAELNVHPLLKRKDILKLLFGKKHNMNINYEEVSGNTTLSVILEAYLKILVASGHEEYELNKLSSSDIWKVIRGVANVVGYNIDVLEFDSTVEGKNYYTQPAYRLWHLLYSYEGDKSVTGNESLIGKLMALCQLPREYASILASVSFKDEYGGLSTKAIRKILPYLKDGMSYDKACEQAGYKHSEHSRTREEIDNRKLKDRLDILPKDSLRNPVVEKVLNQMINVVNAICDQYGKPDEIRIEMARELKKNAKEREKMTQSINKGKHDNESAVNIIKKEFGIQHVSRNDVVRYKLYKELEPNGYKTLYSNTYIPKEKLFSKDFDIEHIIPQARLFDDSFSNKTLESRQVNIEKSNATAYDYVIGKYTPDVVDEYKKRIDTLYRDGKMSKSKHDKLLMTQDKIPVDFLDRDLRNTQYIAKKAILLLEEIVREVVPTIGSITDRLRKDWQLVDVMQELNWDKYAQLGLVEYYQDKDGHPLKRIKDWTKRNDHRHHAMDAITIAFTKRSIIQYLNNLNARGDKSGSIYGIEKKELDRDKNGHLRFNPPMPLDEFRAESKRQLESVIVSIKTKNKVMTRNINITKSKDCNQQRVQLTPRGQLHNETVYGSIRRPICLDVKVNKNLDETTIHKVASPVIREALLNRLREYDGDAKKAFSGKNSLDKKPIWIDDHHTRQVPQRVRINDFVTIYPTRKKVDKDLNVNKVIDSRIRRILMDRIEEYGGDKAKAFADIDTNPIWLNEAKGIAIKRVTIEGLANATPLHDKRDMFGNYILDADGKKQPVDFVNTSSNHHVAIFRDADGVLQEHVVSFMETTARVSQGLPVIDKEYKAEDGWIFLFTMKQNEIFVFPNPETGFDPNEVDLLCPDNYALISENMYRVQKIASKDYYFRHHLETTVEDNPTLKGKTWKRITSLSTIENIVKVRVNHIGQIVSIGEY